MAVLQKAEITAETLKAVLSEYYTVDLVNGSVLYLQEPAVLLFLEPERHLIRFLTYFRGLETYTRTALTAFCNEMNEHFILVKAAYDPDDRCLNFRYDLLYASELDLELLLTALEEVHHAVNAMLREFYELFSTSARELN